MLLRGKRAIFFPKSKLKGYLKIQLCKSFAHCNFRLNLTGCWGGEDDDGDVDGDEDDL